MAIDLGYDESGHGDRLLISMQLAITDQAKKLKRQWDKRLKKDSIPYFHAKEFSNYSYGVFAGLDRAQRLKLLNNLSKLSQQHLSIGITAKITKTAYDKRTTQPFRSRWGTAYTFAIQMLVASAYLYAEHRNLQPEFNILIEDGHKHSQQALQSLQETKKAGLVFAIPSRILTLGLGSKVDHPILQAADMLAYSEWRNMQHADDLAIYQAMHPVNSTYQPEFIDFDGELVEAVTSGAEAWLAERLAWGQRKPNAVRE